MKNKGIGMGKLELVSEKVLAGERLNFDDGMTLFQSDDIIHLGMLANTVRWRKHPDPIVTYIIDRNINYTNICVVKCSFCAFYRNVGDTREGYVLSHEVIGKKIEETKALGGNQILMQGGLNPALKLSYYEDLLRFIKQNYGIWIHAFSPAEILYIAKISSLSLRETIQRLKAAGLDSIPGGGAEILTDSVREEIAPFKNSADKWLEVMRTAHELGMRTTATMMFGSVDTYADRVNHFLKVRELQDQTGGLTAFISWTYQPLNTQLGGKETSSVDYLKTQAISRLMMDNIDNIQVSWVTQGPKVGQIALEFGANDFGSLMIEENVVSAAGAKFNMTLEELIRLITDAGYTPRQRTMKYELVDNPVRA